MNQDELTRRNYESKVFSHIHWLRSANNLLASSKLLEPEILKVWKSLRAHSKDRKVPIETDFYQGPYFMLIAFAFENLFKASLVQKNSARYKANFRENSKFPKELEGHDLLKLARKANFAYEQNEEDLLRRLTRHAIWAGRYPVPVKYQKAKVCEVFENGQNYNVSWFGKTDVESIKNLIKKTKEHSGLGST